MARQGCYGELYGELSSPRAAEDECRYCIYERISYHSPWILDGKMWEEKPPREKSLEGKMSMPKQLEEKMLKGQGWQAASGEISLGMSARWQICRYESA